MSKPRKFFWFLVAALFLFEAWLWDKLGSLLTALVAVLPIKPLRENFETFVHGLSPVACLGVFVLPVAPLLPLKLAALYFLAHHHVVLGVSCFVLVKLVGFATGAYLFELCKPKLLQLPLFARLYATLIRWRALAHDYVEPYRLQMRAKIEELRATFRQNASPRVAALIERLRARSRRWIAARK